MNSVISIDHHIQREIYNRLVTAEGLRYSELKPKDIEANLFMYHLKELIKSGLVEKNESKYALSEKGKLLASRFSMRELNIRQMPTTISVIVLRDDKGEWLLYERSRQPFIGHLGWPSGKIHLGETLKIAAQREVLEKCGYEHIDLELRGTFSLVAEGQGDILKYHVLGHVWTGAVKEKKEIQNSAGQTFWTNKLDKLDYSKFIPGFKEILTELEKGSKPFLLDLHY